MNRKIQNGACRIPASCATSWTRPNVIILRIQHSHMHMHMHTHPFPRRLSFSAGHSALHRPSLSQNRQECPRPRTSEPQTRCTASLHTVPGDLSASRATPAADAASTAVRFPCTPPPPPTWGLGIHGYFQQRDALLQVSKTHLHSKFSRRFRGFSPVSCFGWCLP